MALTMSLGDAELKFIGKAIKGKLAGAIFMAKKELQIRTYEFTESNMTYNCLNLCFREIYFVVSILKFLNSFTVCRWNIEDETSLTLF